MYEFDKEYYDSLNDEQKRNYLEDHNLRMTADRVYGSVKLIDPSTEEGSIIAPLIINDDLGLYKKDKLKRIHPKRNRQRNPNRKRIASNNKKRQAKNINLGRKIISRKYKTYLSRWWDLYLRRPPLETFDIYPVRLGDELSPRFFMKEDGSKEQIIFNFTNTADNHSNLGG